MLGIASYAVYAVHKRLYLLSYAFALQLLGVDLQLYSPWIGIAFVTLLLPACLLLNRWVDEPARRWLAAILGRRSAIAGTRERATQAP